MKRRERFCFRTLTDNTISDFFEITKIDAIDLDKAVITLSSGTGISPDINVNQDDFLKNWCFEDGTPCGNLSLDGIEIEDELIFKEEAKKFAEKRLEELYQIYFQILGRFSIEWDREETERAFQIGAELGYRRGVQSVLEHLDMVKNAKRQS